MLANFPPSFMPPSNFRGRQKVFAGFTLIEILVVLIIVAIITLVAVLAFGDFGQSRKQNLAVLQLKASMLAARQQAILQPAVLSMQTTHTGYIYKQYFKDPKTGAEIWRPLTDDVFSKPSAFSAASKITKINVHFLPNGTISPFNIKILFNDGKAFRVFLNKKTGAIDVNTD